MKTQMVGALTILVSTLAFATVARAQERAVSTEVVAEPMPPASRGDDRYELELESIDAESAWATGLYVAGVAVHVGGLAMAIGGALANFCISFNGSCTGAHQAAEAWLIAGFTVSGVGLAMLGVAIGLDVDSGSRRAGLERRHALRVGLAPARGGATLGLSGSF